MDSWTSVGARLPRQLIADPTFPKPMEEIAYESLLANMDANLNYESPKEVFRLRDSGLWAQMLPLTEMMSQVKELQDKTARDGRSRMQSLDEVQAISHKLDSWLLRLPPRLHNNPENLHWFAERGHGRTFVSLHIGYHHHAQNLYYQFLHQGTENSATQTFIQLYGSRCKEHATALSNLLWLANSTPGCECLWGIIGHLVISSSVHLHTLLFDDDEALIELAKTILKQNFQMMIHLRHYWPSLDMSMSRLRAFQRACQKSMETSFAMDQWMLHFLQRYMKPVGNRDETSTVIRRDSNGENWPTPPDFGSEVDSTGEFQGWEGLGLEATGSDILQSFL